MRLFSDSDWRRLLTQIRDGRTVPVVGPAMLALETDDGRKTLFDYLAKQLVDRLALDEDALGENHALRDVVAEYLRHPENDAANLYVEIRDLMEETQLATPEPLKKLASIRSFDLFVSTTFDSLLERALNEVRFDGEPRTQCAAYNLRQPMSDLPEGYRPAEVPYLFQIFGSLSPLADYAIREDDVLHFTHRLQSRDLQPPNLFDELRNRHLLVLGCGFYGWLVRFFLAAAKGEALFVDGARGVIADDSSFFDDRLVRFLERHKARVYAEGDAVQFVEELHWRWLDRYGDLAPPAPSQPAAEHELADEPKFVADSVFLSYASEDRVVAERIRNSLESANIDVWFDQGALEPGDAYRHKILDNIEHCSFFVPLISCHTTRSEKRFFRREWHKAIDVAEEWPEEHPFIQPVVIDATSEDAPNIPEEFKRRHWLRLQEGQLPREFIELTKQRIRHQRRGGPRR